MKRFLLLFICFSFVANGFENSSFNRELRLVWASTSSSSSNVEWSVMTQTPQEKKSTFITLIDQYKAISKNVLYVQIHRQSDALYGSKIERWSVDLTETRGSVPDPLCYLIQFMIEECHKKGIEFHAWINPYRAISNFSNINFFYKSYNLGKHPDWLVADAPSALGSSLPRLENIYT